MLVQKLEVQGVYLTTDGKDITVETSSPLTDEQRQFLKQHKPKLIAELKGESSNIIQLNPFLKNCCHGLKTNPDEVKKKLLNSGNIEDIVSGAIPARCIRSHVELWIVEGKQEYVREDK